MNTIRKWHVRAGSLFIILGFVMLVMTVSNTTIPGFSHHFRLVDLTSLANRPILFLVSFGALAVITLSLLFTNYFSIMFYYFLSPMIGLAVDIIRIIITLISLNNQINGLQTFKTSPITGSLFHSFDSIISVICINQESREVKKPRLAQLPYRVAGIKSSANINEQLLKNKVSTALQSNPWLEGIRGGFSNFFIPIIANNFILRRSSHNDFQLLDKKVFKQHACLRCTQRSWFIQDRESSGGI
jgi:hypothetical protein